MLSCMSRLARCTKCVRMNAIKAIQFVRLARFELNKLAASSTEAGEQQKRSHCTVRTCCLIIFIIPYVIVIIRKRIEAKSKSKVIALLGHVHYLYSYFHLTLQAALNSTSQTYWLPLKWIQCVYCIHTDRQHIFFHHTKPFVTLIWTYTQASKFHS